MLNFQRQRIFRASKGRDLLRPFPLLWGNIVNDWWSEPCFWANVSLVKRWQGTDTRIIFRNDWKDQFLSETLWMLGSVCYSSVGLEEDIWCSFWMNGAFFFTTCVTQQERLDETDRLWSQGFVQVGVQIGVSPDQRNSVSCEEPGYVHEMVGQDLSFLFAKSYFHLNQRDSSFSVLWRQVLFWITNTTGWKTTCVLFQGPQKGTPLPQLPRLYFSSCFPPLIKSVSIFTIP